MVVLWGMQSPDAHQFTLLHLQIMWWGLSVFIAVVAVGISLNKKLEKIMSQLTDAQAKFDQAATDVKKALTDGAAKIQELADKLANDPSADEVAAVSADLSTQSDALETAAAAMETLVNPPAPPAP